MFSRYLFAYLVTRFTSPAVARIIIDILCQHTYLPTTLFTDIGTQFNSQETKEVAAVLIIELKHATTKLAQTNGLIKSTHALVKAHLKATTGKFRKNWHKFLPRAVLNHNTTYRATLGCESTRDFYGRDPKIFWILNLGTTQTLAINPKPRSERKSKNELKTFMIRQRKTQGDLI